MHIAMLHPDLGLGGAERWVVDTALGLRALGHAVTVYTANHPREACFPETLDGRVPVQVVDTGVPFELAGHLRAPLSVMRMRAVARACARHRQADWVLCDLVAHIVPLARRIIGRPVAFYCHFPDRLLAPPGGRWYRCYRQPLDALERRGLRAADRLMVNSAYTLSRLRDTLAGEWLDARVVTPGIDTDAYAALSPLPADPGSGPISVLSVNRFDPGKRLDRALEAFIQLHTLLPDSLASRLTLTFAGGLDRRRADMVEVYERLGERAQAAGLGERVTRIASPDDATRLALLEQARVVVYTPSNEHFGLVPVEAMAAGRPVVVDDSGGPRTTVEHGVTGFHARAGEGGFAGALARVLADPALAAQMGAAGRLAAAAHGRVAASGRLLAVLETAMEEGVCA